MNSKSTILSALAAASLFYVAVWFADLRKKFPQPSAASLLTGFVTNFFDTLGIGSFAPSTATFKFRRMVPDELIPGTLNVGHTLPVMLQAFIYIAAIQVDPITLALLIASATAGGWFGAGLVGSACFTQSRKAGVSTVMTEERAPELRRPSYEVKKKGRFFCNSSGRAGILEQGRGRLCEAV